MFCTVQHSSIQPRKEREFKGYYISYQIGHLNQKAFLLAPYWTNWELVLLISPICLPLPFFGDLNCNTFSLISELERTVWPGVGLTFQFRLDWLNCEPELVLKLLFVLTGVLLGLYLFCCSDILGDWFIFWLKIGAWLCFVGIGESISSWLLTLVIYEGYFLKLLGWMYPFYPLYKLFKLLMYLIFCFSAIFLIVSSDTLWLMDFILSYDIFFCN